MEYDKDRIIDMRSNGMSMYEAKRTIEKEILLKMIDSAQDIEDIKKIMKFKSEYGHY